MSQSLVLSLVSPVSSPSTWIINGTFFLHTLRRNAFGRKLWKLCKTCVFVRSPKFQGPWSPLLCSLSHFTFCVLCGLNCSFCLTLCDPMDCSPPGSFVHGILQARILKWVAMPSSSVSSQPRDWTCISYFSCIGPRVLYQLPHLASPLCPVAHNYSFLITNQYLMQKILKT